MHAPDLGYIVNQMVEHLLGDRLDTTYGALAHPIRRDIIGQLRAGDARVTDLATSYDVSLAAASKHIAVLESAGLVARRIQGREHHLSLDPRPLADASVWIETYRSFWERRLDALDAMLRGEDP